MFYKKGENGSWQCGKKILLPTKPNSTELNSENKENSYGWEWYDIEPEEYLNWKGTQELDEL